MRCLSVQLLMRSNVAVLPLNSPYFRRRPPPHPNLGLRKIFALGLLGPRSGFCHKLLDNSGSAPKLIQSGGIDGAKRSGASLIWTFLICSFLPVYLWARRSGLGEWLEPSSSRIRAGPAVVGAAVAVINTENRLDPEKQPRPQTADLSSLCSRLEPMICVRRRLALQGYEQRGIVVEADQAATVPVALENRERHAIGNRPYPTPRWCKRNRAPSIGLSANRESPNCP